MTVKALSFQIFKDVSLKNGIRIAEDPLNTPPTAI